ncbi:polyprenyl synthetase family protein [bacterium]|nr:polyprenyl synthetase family protein [candidate division CSSED10-310 bacterium]
MPMYQPLFESLQSIDNSLEDVDRFLLENLTSGNPVLVTLLTEFISRGGKRLRPALVLLAAGACGCRNSKSKIFAVIIELIHTASLFHDDVLDSAETRRGRISINNAYGNHLAILAGDYLYSKALSFLIGEPAAIQQATIDTVLAMTEGELLQSMHRFHISIDLHEYLGIIEKKTAVLMALACRLGASISGTDDQIAAFDRFGRNLGIAFQMIDDLLDWISETEEIGKGILQDFREGRATLPAVLLMKQMNNDDRMRFHSIMVNRKFEHDWNELLNFRDRMIDCGIPGEIRNKAGEYSRLALESLEGFPSSPELSDLKELTSVLLTRNR